MQYADYCHIENDYSITVFQALYQSIEWIVKLWNHSSEYFSCDSPFTPQSGEIQLFNLSASSLLESVQAHDEGKAVWSLCLQPDKVHMSILSVCFVLFLPQRGFVSGSADHTVKFWEFELVSDDDNPTR